MEPERLQQLLWPGLVIESVDVTDGRLVIAGRRGASEACCPDCRRASQRVHSYRERRLQDQPILGWPVILRLQVRRFRCDEPTCPRRTFTEPLAPVAKRWAHRTERLRGSLHRVAMMLGGEAGARLADRLAMPASGTTLLRLLRQQWPLVRPGPRLGVDDWAWRRGQRYGTLIIDLESHRPVDLLPDRSAGTVATWLKAQSGITLVARDRASDYARGIAAGAPAAQQVADRWHLLRNLREALERLCQRLHPQLQHLPISPEMKGEIAWSAKDRSAHRATADEERKRAGYEKRRLRFETVQRLKAAGWSVRQIARELGIHWATAANDYERGQFPPMAPPRRRPSRLDPFVGYLQVRWEAGCHNANQLWREIRGQGYTGSHRMVMLWAQLRRPPSERHPGRPRFNQPLPEGMLPSLDLPAAGHLGWLLICRPDRLDEEGEKLLSHIRQHPMVAAAYELAQQFATMVRERQFPSLEDWLTRATASPVRDLGQFASGLRKDLAAVQAALALPWSSGPVEGNVTRLKLIKRQMYGRAGLDLLRIRVLGET